jgi:hypothetical protein
VLKAHVSLDFNRDTPDEQVGLGNTVIALLTENASVFTDLPVSIADLTTANETLESTYDDFVQFGDSHEGAFLAALESWKDKFTQTAEYVDVVANGSITIINLSGFSHTKTESTKSTKLEAVDTSMKISNAKGEMSALAKGIKGAKGYLFVLATAGMEFQLVGNQVIVRCGQEVVSFSVSTRGSVKFQSLPSKIDVKAVAAAFNSAGLGEFSDVTSITIP